jgi:hypothetical protein
VCEVGRRLPPDDRWTQDAKIYAEETGAVRYELPVTFKGANGVLVIREFGNDVPLEDARKRKEGASARGLAVSLLYADGRNRRERP